jgi:hypothetical protein
MRAITSGALPAAVAMMTFTGRDGQFCACAIVTDSAVAASAIAILHPSRNPAIARLLPDAFLLEEA